MNQTSDSAALAIPACPSDADTSFGPIVQGCRDNFDFTFAFEQYFFSIAPSAVFILLGTVRLAVLLRRKSIVGGAAAAGAPFRLAKLIAAGVFTVAQLSLVILWSTASEVEILRQQAVAGASSGLVAALLLTALSHLEHSKSFRPSWILNAYLFFSIIFDVAILRTLYLSHIPTSIRVTSSIGIGIKCILLLLEARPKRSLQNDGETRETPEEYAGPFSQGLYWWLNGLIKKGFKNVLSVDDLFPMCRDMRAESLNAKFWLAWNQSTHEGKNKLGFVVLRVLRLHLALAIIPRLILIGFIFCQPLLLERFLSYLKDPAEKKDANVGKAMIGAYAVVYLGMAITSGFYWYRAIRSVTMLRSILIAAIYTKTTEINITALNNSESVTLMSGDVENLVRGLREVHELWAAPMQIAIATWLLARQLGVACIGPIVVCIVATFIMGATSGLAKKYQMSWMEALQKRTGITASVIGSIKGIKMLGLSGKMRDLIQRLRVSEVRVAKKFRLLVVFSSTFALVPVMISPVVTFAIFIGTSKSGDRTLDATRLFTSLSLLILITQPLFGVFQDIFTFRSSMASMDRIEAFLKKDTRGDHRFVSSRSTSSLAAENAAGDNIELGRLSFQRTEQIDGNFTMLEVRDGAFGWKRDDEPLIKDLNFLVGRGDLVMICGPVASGKSTLLKSILGETVNLKGFVRLSTDSIAYCDQTPWLMNTSIKNNIAGFSGFDQAFYQEVVSACDLNTDFSTLPNGDETLVGSKGVTLSGGQKQRVALARAIYAKKQLVILDDVFSGLDLRTQSKVFSRIFGRHGLSRRSNTTVILATHAVSLSRHADKVYVLSEQGTIAEQDRSDILASATATSEEECEEVSERGKLREDQTSDAKEAPNIPAKTRQGGDWSLYTYLFSQIGPNWTIFFLSFEVLWAFFVAFPAIWLKWWSDVNESSPNEKSGLYIGVYATLQAAGLCSWALLTWCCFDIMARKAGIKLHRVLANTTMSASMAYISKTDVGSLVNRFTQDLGIIDKQLPLSLMCCVSNLFIAIAQGILIATASPYIAISFPALICAFYLVQKYYLRTSRQLRLLDLEAKAPVYTLFLESLEGLATIRAFGWQKECIKQNYELVDRAQRPFHLLAVIQKWLTLVLDILTAVLAVIVVSVAVVTRETVSVGLTGVALTQIISFTDYLKMFMLFWTQLETSLGALARIRDFSQDTPGEGLSGESGDTPPGWPQAGEIELKGLSAGYDNENMVLKDVSISIGKGERVGVCGRTGSGKSSLVQAILRMIELSSGSINIDGIDIATLPREKLRFEINTISQDPFFFSGTVGQNLDPFGSASAEDMKIALLKCQLGCLFDADRNLDSEFLPESLSHGQRQLFCLARALLRPSKIFILDEATSNVDKETDSVMQKVIREDMKDKTIIAIAHRLETIQDFDRVIVLEEGRVAEVGSPSELLETDSKFRQLANAAEQG